MPGQVKGRLQREAARGASPASQGWPRAAPGAHASPGCPRVCPFTPSSLPSSRTRPAVFGRPQRPRLSPGPRSVACATPPPRLLASLPAVRAHAFPLTHGLRRQGPPCWSGARGCQGPPNPPRVPLGGWASSFGEFCFDFVPVFLNVRSFLLQADLCLPKFMYLSPNLGTSECDSVETGPSRG